MTIFSALSCADNWQILVHSLTVIGKEEQHTCLPMRPSSATKVTPPPPTVLKYTNHYRTLVRSDLKNGKLNSKSSPIFSALRKYVRRTSSRIFAGRISSSILTFKTFLIKHCWLGAEFTTRRSSSIGIREGSQSLITCRHLMKKGQTKWPQLRQLIRTVVQKEKRKGARKKS